MGREKKAHNKKGKFIGAIAGTAMMAVPFMAIPAAANAETELSEIPVVEMDKIQTIVIPEGSKKYINLNNLYDFAREFEVEHTSGFANVNENLLQYGVLELSANPLAGSSTTGLATFTVTVTPYEGEVTFDDTFNVVVVPSADTGANSKFNIKNVVTLLQNFSTAYSEKSEIQELMSHIDLTSTAINKRDPFNQDGNTAPVAKNNVTPFEMFPGQDFDVSTFDEGLPQFVIEDYYEDPDTDEANEEYDRIQAVFTSQGNEYIRVNNTQFGQTLTPLKSSDTPIYLPVVVLDSRGGVTSGTIPFMVRTPEVFEIDAEASISLDLHNYFNDIDETSDFQKEILDIGEHSIPEGWNEPLEIDGTKVRIASHDAIYRLEHLKAGNIQQSIYFIVKYNSDLYDNHLTDSAVYESSTLEIDLDQMFPQSEGATIQYSVNHLNPSTVTSDTYLTYEISIGNTITFTARYDAADNEEQEPYDFTVIGKDVSNHVTYVDRINLSPLNYYNGSIYASSLFDWYKDGSDVVVSSSTPGFDFEIRDYGSGLSAVELKNNNSTDSTTTVVLKLSNNSVVYKLPFILN